MLNIILMVAVMALLPLMKAYIQDLNVPFNLTLRTISNNYHLYSPTDWHMTVYAKPYFHKRWTFSRYLISGALQNESPVEGDIPPHLAVRSDAYTDDTNRTMKSDKYPGFTKDDKK